MDCYNITFMNSEYEIIVEKEGCTGYQTYNIGTVCIQPKYDDPQFGEEMKKIIIQALNLKILIDKEAKEYVTSHISDNFKITPRGYGKRLEDLITKSKMDVSL